MVPDLRQSDTLNGPTPRSESVFTPLTLQCKALPVSLHQLFVDGLALLFDRLPKSLKGLVRGLDIPILEDRGRSG